MDGFKIMGEEHVFSLSSDNFINGVCDAKITACIPVISPDDFCYRIVIPIENADI